MTAEEWEYAMKTARTPEEVESLRRRRPRGAKAVRSGGMQFNLGANAQGDLLNKLQTGQKS